VHPDLHALDSKFNYSYIPLTRYTIEIRISGENFHSIIFDTKQLSRCRNPNFWIGAPHKCKWIWFDKIGVERWSV